MAMSITKRMADDGAAIHYTAEWMRMIESHLTFLRAVSADNVVQVEPQMAYKYEGDLYGLLQQLRVRSEYRWVVMRLNDMTNPDQLAADRTTLVFPDFKLVESLTKTFQTSKKKIN